MEVKSDKYGKLTQVYTITDGMAGFANDLQVISHTLPIRQVHNLAQPLTFPPYSTTIAIHKSCF